MNERHAKVLAVLEGGPKRSRDIARELGQSVDYTSDLCCQLRDMGLAKSKRDGPDGRSLFWRAIEGAEEPDDAWANRPRQVIIRDARTAPQLRPRCSADVFTWDGSWPSEHGRGPYQR